MPNSKITLPQADIDTFNQVMTLYQIPADDIELCKQSYRRDPEASKIGYRAMLGELTGRWRADMAAGINERMKR
jgi:hypothetical protein